MSSGDIAATAGAIDWHAIEQRHGPIDEVQRAQLQMEVLADDSRRLLTWADQVERWNQHERADIEAAHAHGKTVENYVHNLEAGSSADPGSAIAVDLAETDADAADRDRERLLEQGVDRMTEPDPMRPAAAPEAAC